MAEAQCESFEGYLFKLGELIESSLALQSPQS